MGFNKLDFLWFNKDSVIGNGQIIVPTHINIAGLVKIDIESAGKVIVAESGKVQGTINASEVLIHGEVTGDIIGAEKVIVYNNGVVNGSVTSKKLIIAEGATCNFSMNIGEEIKPAHRLKRASGVSEPVKMDMAVGV